MPNTQGSGGGGAILSGEHRVRVSAGDQGGRGGGGKGGVVVGYWIGGEASASGKGETMTPKAIARASHLLDDRAAWVIQWMEVSKAIEHESVMHVVDGDTDELKAMFCIEDEDEALSIKATLKSVLKVRIERIDAELVSIGVPVRELDQI